MLLVSYAGKNAYSASNTNGVLRGGASGANRGCVLAHCAQLKGKAPRGHSNLLSPDRMDPGWMEPCGRWMMVTKIGERLIQVSKFYCWLLCCMVQCVIWSLTPTEVPL